MSAYTPTRILDPVRGVRTARASLQSCLRAARVLALVAAAALQAAAATDAAAHDDPDARVAELTRQMADDPASAALHLERAEVHRFRRDWPAALADLQDARRLDPALAAVDLALARLMFDQDNLAAARDAIDRFLAARPDNQGAYLVRARIEARQGQRQAQEQGQEGAQGQATALALAAAADVTRAIELDRASRGDASGIQPDDYLLRARALVTTGRIDEAIAGLDQGYADLGGPVTLGLAAVEIEESHGRVDAALARVAGLEAKARRKESWQARRADLLDKAGRHDEAAAARRDALASIAALPSGLRSSTATAALEADLRRRLGLPAAAPAAATQPRAATSPAAQGRNDFPTPQPSPATSQPTTPPAPDGDPHDH